MPTYPLSNKAQSLSVAYSQLLQSGVVNWRQRDRGQKLGVRGFSDQCDDMCLTEDTDNPVKMNVYKIRAINSLSKFQLKTHSQPISSTSPLPLLAGIRGYNPMEILEITGARSFAGGFLNESLYSDRELPETALDIHFGRIV